MKMSGYRYGREHSLYALIIRLVKFSGVIDPKMLQMFGWILGILILCCVTIRLLGFYALQL